MEKPFSLGIKLKKIEARFSTTGTYLECTTGNHSKYYYMYIIDNPDKMSDFPYLVEFHFGRLGTEGTKIHHKFKYYEDAEKHLAKKVKQKLEKDYVRLPEPTNYTKF